MTEIEGLLQELAQYALARIPAKLKLSLKDLAEVPWIAAELESIKKEEQTFDEEVTEEEGMEYVVVTDLIESFTVNKTDVDGGEWVKDMIRKALRTKPVDATHLVLYTP